MNSRSFSLLLLCSLSICSSLTLGAACGGKAIVPSQANAAGASSGGVSASAGDASVITAGTPNSGGASAGSGSASAGSGAVGIAGSTSTGGSGTGGNGTDGSAGGTLNDAPSCSSEPATCGPTQSESCCASRAVPGGSYDRKYNQDDFPATVSDFVLDKYEVTVARFRNFVAVYSPDIIPAGAGKNPHNLQDPGWDPSWNALMPKTAGELKKAIQCDADIQTWTDSPGTPTTEHLPITCLSWFEAEAFCIWDHGRLPTDAEWTYVASGGAEQRPYPWGSAAPDCSYANYLGAPNGMEIPYSCVKPGSFDGAANPVGSESPQGDGKWGHADMGGNISEWTQDFSQSIMSPCNDCANLTPNASQYRLVKGGAFFEQAQNMRALYRSPGVQSVHLFGARCARATRN